MKRSEGKACNLCAGEHEKWWDCPNLVHQHRWTGQRTNKFNYGFSVKGGTPKFHGK